METTLADIEKRRAALNVQVDVLCQSAGVNTSTYYKNLADAAIKTTGRILGKLGKALDSYEAAMGAPVLAWRLDDIVERRMGWLDFHVLTPALEFTEALKFKLINAINEQCAEAGGSALFIQRCDVSWEKTRWTITPWFWVERTGKHEPLSSTAMDDLTVSAQNLLPWQTDLKACPKLEVVELMLFAEVGTRILGVRDDRVGFYSTETKKPVSPIAWRPAAEFRSSVNEQFYFGNAPMVALQAAE